MAHPLSPLQVLVTDLLRARTAERPERVEAFVDWGVELSHVVDDDLLAALDSGHINAATLDVFHIEPLPADHAYWTHPKVTVTPHMASLTVPSSAADWMEENIKLIEAGKPPLNTVDVKKGY